MEAGAGPGMTTRRSCEVTYPRPVNDVVPVETLNQPRRAAARRAVDALAAEQGNAHVQGSPRWCRVKWTPSRPIDSISSAHKSASLFSP